MILLHHPSKLLVLSATNWQQALEHRVVSRRIGVALNSGGKLLMLYGMTLGRRGVLWSNGSPRIPSR
jgi:hypothetical protein